MSVYSALPPVGTPAFIVSEENEINGRPAVNYHIMGSRTLGWTATNILGDACDYLDTSQALMNTPTVGQTLYLISTSVNDTAAGTGARTVRTVYLDSNGNQQVRTDTLNGTTQVNIGTGYSFIQWMEVDSLGSSEVSAGDITISSTNGAATVATTFEKISAGGNRSLSGRYKVPTGRHAHIYEWDSSAPSTFTMDARIRAQVFADDSSLSTVYHFLDRTFLPGGGLSSFSLPHLIVPSGGVIKVSALPGNASATARFDCSFHIIVMDN